MAYWDEIRQNIADIRVWLTEVEAKLDQFAPAARYTRPAGPPVAPPTSSVDEDVAVADSVTRIHKALEREFKVDRRTIYAYIERVVEAYGLHHQVPDWRANIEFHKRFAERDASGKTRLERALIQLNSKSVVAA